MRFGLFCIFIILCICSLLLGAEQIQWSTLFSFSHESWLTLTASRIPRLITIVLTVSGWRYVASSCSILCVTSLLNRKLRVV